MEQMEEINKLRYKVEAMDGRIGAVGTEQNQGEKGARGEYRSWMFKLGKMEYDEISRQEAAEVPPPSVSEGGVGFGFGSGIRF